MKYKIGESVDGKGETVSIWHTDSIGQEHKVAAMYLRGMAFLLDRDWAYAPFNLVTNGHKAIWVENADGIPMGGVIYEYHNHNKQGWIVMIFTEEEFRGRHIYTIVQNALEVETIKLGGTSIASMAHKDNEARLKAGEREGMLPQFYRLYKDLTPTMEETKKALVKEYRQQWPAIVKERWNG